MLGEETRPRGSAGGGRRRAVGAAGVLEIILTQSLVGAEQDVLRHVRREPARGRPPPERLGQAADVGRPGAAAEAEGAHAERGRLSARLGDLVAATKERVQRVREGPRWSAG